MEKKSRFSCQDTQNGVKRPEKGFRKYVLSIHPSTHPSIDLFDLIFRGTIDIQFGEER